MSRKIVTGDIFEAKGSTLRVCQKRAGFFGLRNLCVSRDGIHYLTLVGGKLSLLAYYASTMFVADTPVKMIRRIAEIARVK